MTASASAAGLHTLGRWVRDSGELTPGRTAVITADGEVTYGDLARRSEALARRLAGAGVRHGDRIATLTGNSVDHVVAFFACALTGCILAPLNWRLAAAELAYQIDDCTPALILTGPGHAEQAGAALDAATAAPPVVPLGVGGVEQGVPRLGPPAPDHAVVDDDPVLLIYTSGTTGRPKGALLTHGNCFWTNLSLSRTAGMTSEDVVLAVLPQFHVGGWNVQPLLAWWCGATVVLPDGFDPGQTLRLIAEHRVTTMMGVPATYQFLAGHPDFASTDFSSLTLAIVGGAPMPEPLLHIWIERKVLLTQGYGLTEAAPNVLCLPPDDAIARLGWAGKPYPYVEVGLMQPDSDMPLAGPGDGELVVRGPNVFAGYWNLPDASAQAVRSGWLHTGDIAERDADGYYRLRGRLKEMYVSGGENVYPAEVESVLADHPDIVEAAVVGIFDERWGEVGYATVVRRDGSDLDEAAVREFCRARIAKYKVPVSFAFVDALPRSAVGKIDKAPLRAAAMQDRGES